jgi:hypothetical protein
LAQAVVSSRSQTSKDQKQEKQEKSLETVREQNEILKQQSETVKQQTQTILSELSNKKNKTGSVATSLPESNRKAHILSLLRNEFILSHDNISAGLMAGTESPPAEWLNKRLGELNEHWKVTDVRSEGVGRKLTEEQEAGLGRFAESHGDVNFYVRVLTGSIESQQFGKEIWNALEQRGARGSLIYWAAEMEPMPTGIVIATGSGDNTNAASSAAAALMLRMSQLGIPSTHRQGFSLTSDNAVDIIVGIKPAYN